MEPDKSPRKKLKSPAQESVINPKTSVTCINVPEGLFDATAAKKHFSKFGRVQRIRLFPKKQMCIIEYDQPNSAERAVLNAGAFDGFMFDVTRSKARVRRRSKKEDDPDWVPDSEVEEELSAMGGAPTYRVTRTHPNQGQSEVRKIKASPRAVRPTMPIAQPAIKKKIAVAYHPSISQPVSGTESPVQVATMQTSMSTSEAAGELHQLRFRVSLTADEQWRTLEARDRILRAWGGAGSRVKVGGATIGTCQDMCPEKELLHRQAEHQVMTLETVPDSDGQLDVERAVKQYSRSSADQEMPMCYELRPPAVLLRTCAYLLHEIADTRRQISLADWFHFMWDRFRSIRKDITQQALCCAESIQLVEMCARFHAHCAARLADLEHTQFDQKLNTDNLTKCLQTLKHMYADVGPEHKPNEAEFRGYIALLNLGDANFWWEIKQLPRELQKSEPVILATQVFNAIDNNNYVRFFRLVQQKASYLQACILLRYFNDVRARALARIVKAYAPRGGSRFPAADLMNALAFESIESMKFFINHYGLRFAKNDDIELTIILDRNQFIEDSDPYPISRAISLIESKRTYTVGQVIAGGDLPAPDFRNHRLYTSFTKEGKLKETALLAEEQGYNTINDSNKNIQSLKDEITRLGQGQRNIVSVDTKLEQKASLFVKPEPKFSSPEKPVNTFITSENKMSPSKQFSFKPAIPVAPVEVIKNSPEKIFDNDAKNVFSFAKPQAFVGSGMFVKNGSNLFKSPGPPTMFDKKSDGKNIFARSDENTDPFQNNQNLFKAREETSDATNVFKQQEVGKSLFGQFESQNKSATSIFAKAKDNVTLAKPDSTVKFATTNNIFAKPAQPQENEKTPANIFGTFTKTNKIGESYQSNIFSKPSNPDGSNLANSIFNTNGEATNAPKLSPSSLFKSAVKPLNGPENKGYSIFQSKNKGPSVADNIFNSVGVAKESVYDFNQNENNQQTGTQNYDEETIKEEERQLQERIRKEKEEREEALQLKFKEEEKRREDERRREEEKRRKEEIQKEEARRRQEELRQLEEKRRKEEERKQEELRRKMEEEKEAELKRKAKEEAKLFRERVEKESTELINELINEINDRALSELLKEELEKFNNLMFYADEVRDELLSELCNEICNSEMKAEVFLTEKLKKKWFEVWKTHFIRNSKRRRLLEDTPVWLTENTPVEEASHLRRQVENAALMNMNAIHRGYKFNGELKLLPSPEPYNLMDIIRSPLLKRMKQINYPYDKCFFWKLTLVSPGEMKWLYRIIEVEKWLIDAFSDGKKHDASPSLIQVGKQSWNHLMDFAISVSLTNQDKYQSCSEAVEGTNGLLLYATENDQHLTNTIETIMKNKYPYQIIPVAIIMPKAQDSTAYNILERLLADMVNHKIISVYKIFVLEPQNISETLSLATKTALKWLAKKYPQIPPLEIDLLKSVCQRYLGNEIWCRLRTERDGRMRIVVKDLQKLVDCYNTAVEKLTDVITDESLFNFPSFPLEFRGYLNNASPFPKPYEFIPSNVKTTDNIWAIKNMMEKLKLPTPNTEFQPRSVVGMQQAIRKYCNQIGWFDNPEKVVCRVVSLLPNELSHLDMSREEFAQTFAHYDLVDILNIIVYEKINGLNNFDNRFVIYEKSVLQEYRDTHWLFEIDVLSKMKHKAIEYDEDELDMFIDAKRRKIAIDSMEYLMLEDKDSTMVEQSIKSHDETICRISSCTEAVKQLEQQIDNEKKKSMELENLLKLALADV